MSYYSIRDNTSKYSGSYSRMIRYVSENQALLSEGLSLVEDKPSLIPVDYNVAPWPVIINQKLVKEFESIIDGFPDLLRKAIRKYFRDDVEKFEAYFSDDGELLEAINEVGFDDSFFVARHDLVFSSGELKLLEVNAGTNLGGFEVDWIHQKNIHALNLVENVLEKDVRYTSVLKSLLRSLSETSSNLATNAKINVLICVDLTSDESINYVQQYVAAICKEESFLNIGAIALCNSFEEVLFKEGGEVCFKGVNIDCILLPNILIDNDSKKQLNNSFNNNKILFPDSELHRFMGNKLLMAVLHEEDVMLNLLDSERNFIEKYIPWTVKLASNQVMVNGDLKCVIQYALDNKDSFVLKRADSQQGKGVVVGRFINQQDWEFFVNKGVSEACWIVQRYYEPDNIWASNLQGEIKSFSPVWGVFQAGSSYGGAVVRAVETNKDNGIINAAAGAIVLSVFQSEEYDFSDFTSNYERGSRAFEKAETWPTVSYSHKYQDIIKLVRSDFRASLYRVNLEDETVPNFMKNYKYSMSPWPFLISSDIKSSLEKCVKQLMPLIYKAISLFFGKDGKKFETYFNDSEVILQLINGEKDLPTEIFIRHDAVFVNGVIKLLETNAGSNIGGWEYDWIYHIFENKLKEYKKFESTNVVYRNITKRTFEVIKNSIQKLDKNNSGKCLMYFDSYGGGENVESLKYEYRKIFSKVFQSDSSELLFFSDFKDISFNVQGDLLFENKVIDAVLLPLKKGVDIPHHILIRLLSGHLSKRICFPDSPLHMILNSKFTFALLHEPELFKKLNAAERDFIEKHIPWTFRLNKKYIEYKGCSIKVSDLLRVHKAKFVIKKAESLQGRDVFVGRFMDQNSWQNKIVEVEKQEGWIAQEYCNSDLFEAISESGDVEIFRPVWGVFELGNEYAGTFIRAVNNGCCNGVVNSDAGATEFVVFEEQSFKNKVVL